MVVRSFDILSQKINDSLGQVEHDIPPLNASTATHMYICTCIYSIIIRHNTHSIIIYSIHTCNYIHRTHGLEEGREGEGRQGGCDRGALHGDSGHGNLLGLVLVAVRNVRLEVALGEVASTTPLVVVPDRAQRRGGHRSERGWCYQ